MAARTAPNSAPVKPPVPPSGGFTAGFVGQKANAGGVQVTPCGDPNRSLLDVAGRINDLINCYFVTGTEFVKVYGPQIIVAVLLIAIMLFTVYRLIKD